MSGEIITVLDELCRRFGIVIDWSSQNVVPQLEVLVQKAVTYEYWTSVMWLVFGFVLIVIGLGIAIIGVKHTKKDADKYGGYYDPEVFMPYVLLTIAFFFVGIPIVMCQVTDMIACQTFPEKIVLDMLKEYLKRASF